METINIGIGQSVGFFHSAGPFKYVIEDPAIISIEIDESINYTITGLKGGRTILSLTSIFGQVNKYEVDVFIP